MKKNGSTKAKASVPKKTARKMLNMPFCAYLVQISTTFLLSETEALSEFSSLMLALMNSTARYAGGYGLHGCAGEPVDHGAAGDQAEKNGAWSNEIFHVHGQAIGEAMMMEKIMVSRRLRRSDQHGLRVALKVLPAPSSLRADPWRAQIDVVLKSFLSSP